MPTCTINCDTQDAIIRYTTNGNDPTESDTVYSIPFSVDAGTTVKVKAWKEGMNPSAVASAEAPEELQPTSVPLGSVLSDGSVVIYDRGSTYGDYNLTSGVLARLSEGTDDESATSENWRFLIADSADMEGNNGGVGQNKPWGPTESIAGTTYESVGDGLLNTNSIIAEYGTNDSYLWKTIVTKRESTQLKWYVPNKGEIEYINNRRTDLDIQGSSYFTSNQYDQNSVWNYQLNQYPTWVYGSKSSIDCRVRLLRRY